MVWSETLNTFDTTQSVPNSQQFPYDPLINKSDPGLIFSGTETNAIYTEAREVGGDFWIVQNATYNGTNWVPKNTALPVYADHYSANGVRERVSCAAGTNPVVWTTIFSIDASGNVKDALGYRRKGTLTGVAVDGTTPGSVVFTPAFPTGVDTVLVTIENDGSANPWNLGYSISGKSKTGFSVWVYGGPSGSSITIDYLAFGS